MAKVEYGLQLWSLHDITPNDLRGALKEVAKIGYKYVEFAGFFGHSAEEVKSWLDEYGLIASGTHTGIDQLADDKIDDVIAYHKAIGCQNLIVPGAGYHNKETLNDTIDLLNRAQKKLAEHSIRLGYHNHSKEFMPNYDGQIFEDELIARSSVEIELDTFWAFNAGKDPVAVLESIKDRVRVIHLKDGLPSAPESRDFDHVHDNVKGKSVGSGMAPVKAVREWAIKNNVLMVIESEGLDPTGLEEVARCMSFLRSLEA